MHQDNVPDNLHTFEVEPTHENPLVQKMLLRLAEAAKDEEIRRQMDVEDEIDRIFERGMKKVAAEKDKIIAEKDQEIVAKDQELVEERQKAETERQKAETERQRNEELLRQIEELKKQLKK